LSEATHDATREAEILGFLSWIHQTEGRIGEALECARGAVVAAETAGDPVLLARSLGRAALEETWAMDVTPGLLERGVAIEAGLEERLPYDRPTLTRARRDALTGRYAEAREIYETALADAAESGDDDVRGPLLFHLALVEWYDGQPARALAVAADGLELADQLHDDQYRTRALHAASFIDAHLGLHDRARAAAVEGLELSEAVGDSIFATAHRNVLGFIELTDGRDREAAERFRDVPNELISRAWVEPAFNPLWPNAIEAAVRVGDLELARAEVTELEARSARSISPWSRAIAWRCRALLEAASGDAEAADAAFRNAVEEHAQIRAPFDRARTALAWGSHQRRLRSKRLAHDLLEEAQRAFAAIGAQRWAARAGAELNRIGGRRPGTALLTPAEERVADLTGLGLSNKEIAARLGCSVGTVETHLTKVYGRLGLHSRVELSRWLADRNAAAAFDNPRGSP